LEDEIDCGGVDPDEVGGGVGFGGLDIDVAAVDLGGGIEGGLEGGELEEEV
jgi:hypothetical protein